MPPAPKKILIVEDEPGIAQLVKLYLEKEGFHTTVANSGVDALKLMKAERPDLLVLDLMLPEIDGIEVCKKIRTVPDTDAVNFWKHEVQNQKVRIFLQTSM